MEEKNGTSVFGLSKSYALLAVGAAVLVPFLGLNQIVTGTTINFLLFATPKKYVWPVIILPSLSVMARGIIFGPFTLFLYYFIPFIWLGNWILTLNGHPFKRILGKVAVLYLAARVYFELKIVPEAFLISMGGVQFITAILGWVLWKISVRSLKNFWNY